MIQTPGRKDVSLDIVFLQLQNIWQTFKSKGREFEFLILCGPNLRRLREWTAGECEAEFFFYVIKLSHETVQYLAEEQKLPCFNFQRKVGAGGETAPSA